MALGQNKIAMLSGDPFCEVANPAETGLRAPPVRLGESLRTAVRSLSGFQKEALVASSARPQIWRLVSDEGPYLNGHDAAPCPLAFVSAGMAAGFMEEITSLARKRGMRFGRLKLILDNYYTMKGSLRDGTMTGGAEPVHLTVEAECSLTDSELSGFLADAVAGSPMNGLIRGQLASLFKLNHNGRELPPHEAAELDAALLADPEHSFSKARPGACGEPLMSKAGVTPKKAVARGTSAAGSSLTDHQDRRLNIGAIAERRSDGMTEIRQMQYSPHGTSFKFLSSQNGRAPDANSLVSAGIGFCFMTQFGRFASMAKLDLSEYRIVQDTHFSLGGASAGTSKGGTADPVETHVFLVSGEPEKTAAQMLDVSERTCFLHALCRTDLKVKILPVRR